MTAERDLRNVIVLFKQWLCMNEAACSLRPFETVCSAVTSLTSLNGHNTTQKPAKCHVLILFHLQAMSECRTARNDKLSKIIVIISNNRNYWSLFLCQNYCIFMQAQIKRKSTH